MGAGIADHLLAMLGEQFDRDGIPHGACGDEEGRLLAGDLGRALLQTVDCGVFTVNIISDLRLIHRFTHFQGGKGNRVTAQIYYLHCLNLTVCTVNLVHTAAFPCHEGEDML